MNKPCVNILCSLIERLNIVKMSVILKLICRFKAVPIKIPAFFFFVGVNKLIVKFIWKCKVPRIVKITLKMSDIVGRLTLPGFKIDYKATVSKAV